jgi:hypothetical protein
MQTMKTFKVDSGTDLETCITCLTTNIHNVLSNDGKALTTHA